MHGRLSTHDEQEAAIGIDKISKVVNLSISKNKNTFWLDAGDFTHGTPRMQFGSLDLLINTLNSTHLNTIVTGNHDYNVSVDNLKKLSKLLNATIISANTVDRETGALVLLPYMVYDVDLSQNDYEDISGDSNDSLLDNIRLGIFGLSTPETAQKTNPENVKDIEFKDPVIVARNMVSMLRTTCHVIIALTHLGLDESSDITSKRLAEEVDGIDLIVDGHSHTELPTGLTINDTLIVQTGAHGKFLGKVTLSVENKQLQEIRAELLDEDQVDDIIKKPDIFLEKKLGVIDELTNRALNHIVASIDRDLPGKREVVRCKEAELGNLVADAIRWKTGTDIAFINGGNLRTGLVKGPLTIKDLVSMNPFGNTIQSVRISGKILRQVLEHSVFSVPAAFGGFLHPSGLTFTLNPSAPIGERVSDIFVGDKPLENEEEYTLSTADFLLVGGDGYNMLTGKDILKDYGPVEQVLIDYLNTVSIGDISCHRIKVVT